MSADLFDAFASPPPPSNTTANQQASSLQADDDDWGDFSSEPVAAAPAPAPASLMHLHQPVPKAPSQPPPASSSSNADLLFSSFSSPTAAAQAPLSTRPTPAAAPAHARAPSNDEWGDFIYTPRIPTPPPQHPNFSLSRPLENPNYSHPATAPPPVHALLQALSAAFQLPAPFLSSLKPLPFPLRQRVLVHARTRQFLAAIVQIARVAGRIIAGRKGRAKRVGGGGGGGGGKGGMSLKATAKPDAMKDEREVRELVRIWGETVGGLRAAVVNSGITVPDIDFDMAVVKGNSASGGAAAGQQKKVEEVCWLCGLLRVETVPKLREGGTGSLSHLETKGEAEEARWMNGWGHRGCKNWWEGEGANKLG